MTVARRTFLKLVGAASLDACAMLSHAARRPADVPDAGTGVRVRGLIQRRTSSPLEPLRMDETGRLAPLDDFHLADSRVACDASPLNFFPLDPQHARHFKLAATTIETRTRPGPHGDIFSVRLRAHGRFRRPLRCPDGSTIRGDVRIVLTLHRHQPSGIVRFLRTISELPGCRRSASLSTWQQSGGFGPRGAAVAPDFARALIPSRLC